MSAIGCLGLEASSITLLSMVEQGAAQPGASGSGGGGRAGGYLAARFERVREVYGQLAGLPPTERVARLEAIRAEDATLHRAIVGLLREADEAEREGFLEPGSTGRGRDDGSMNAAEADPIPERIGRYRVAELLGTGATGVVYRGEADAPLRRSAAIKVVREAASKRAAERFALEINALASLNHPAIAGVFESGMLPDGRRWAAYELVEGSPVTRAAQDHCLTWEQRVELVRQAAVGVHHAHRRGVVHRDLKPSNILAGAGEHGVVWAKVIDFGVARLTGPHAPSTTLTEPGLLVGTLAYMSPEQLRGGPVDARTDVYALGLVLYELLSGRPARDSGSRSGIGPLTQSAERPVLGRLPVCGGRGRDIEGVIACATDPDPDRRYASAQHLAEDLERVLTERPVLARRPSVCHRLCLCARRHPAFTILGVLAVDLLVVLGTGLGVSRAQLSAESRDQREMLISLIHDTLNDLSTISGTGASRERMVEILTERTDRLLAMFPDDPELLLAKARLLRERGDLYGLVGRPSDAHGYLVSSHELYEVLHQIQPDNLRIGRLYAESIIRIGDVLNDMDEDRDEVRRMYEQAMRIQERLLAINPSSLTLLDDYSWSYDRLAAFYHPIDDAEALRAWRLERLRLAEDLHGRDPERLLSVFNLGKALYDLAHTSVYNEKHDDASEYYRQSIVYLHRLVEQAPERGVYTYFYINAQRNLLQAEQELGISEPRSERASMVVDAAREHARRDPGNIRAEVMLIRALSLAARWHESWSEPEMARSLAEESLGRIQSIHDRGIEIDLGLAAMENAMREILDQADGGPGDL